LITDANVPIRTVTPQAKPIKIKPKCDPARLRTLIIFWRAVTALPAVHAEGRVNSSARALASTAAMV
jgi:hypothetical protein